METTRHAGRGPHLPYGGALVHVLDYELSGALANPSSLFAGFFFVFFLFRVVSYYTAVVCAYGCEGTGAAAMYRTRAT